MHKAWTVAPVLIAKPYKKVAAAAQAVLRQLPHTGTQIFYNHTQNRGWIAGIDKTASTKIAKELQEFTTNWAYSKETPAGYPYDVSWIKIAGVGETIGKLMHLRSGKLFGLPIHASPLNSVLASGILGAGLGYGLGWLGSKFLPDDWDKERMPTTGAMLGAGLGMTPGLLAGLTNLAGGKSFNDPGLLNSGLAKTSSYRGFSSSGLQPIPVQEFNNVIWNDPRVAYRLPQQTQVAASGLVNSAAHLSGGSPGVNWVTPKDIGILTAGMGSGYLSGMIVGKALGTLMGMPEKTQNKLKQTGTWAGVVANLVPLAFR